MLCTLSQGKYTGMFNMWLTILYNGRKGNIGNKILSTINLPHSTNEKHWTFLFSLYPRFQFAADLYISYAYSINILTPS